MAASGKRETSPTRETFFSQKKKRTHLLPGQVDADRTNTAADVQKNHVRVEIGEVRDGLVQNFGSSRIHLEKRDKVSVQVIILVIELLSATQF